MAKRLIGILKRSSTARAVNARFKCWQAKRRYARTIDYYEGKGGASPTPRHTPYSIGGTPKVFFVGTDEQQDKSGFIQALQRHADVRFFVREDGAWGQNDPAPYAQRRERNSHQLLALMRRFRSEGWVPDIVLMQTWACLIDPAALRSLRRDYGVIVINISMDDRHQYWGRRVDGLWDGIYSLIPELDLALTAAPEAVAWYEKEGCPALFFPEASDREVFGSDQSGRKSVDVSFVGSRYGIREQVVLALRRAGIQVEAYGSGWEGGRIATEAVPRLFSESKIVLGVSAIGHCPDFVGLKLRDFDAPMSGSCYLTQHNDDLDLLFDVGREIVTYRSIDECVERAQFLLKNSHQRETIAAAGHERVVADHTWDKRFQDLFAYMRGEA